MAFCIDWLEVSRSVQLGHRRTNTLDVDASGNVLNIAGNAEIVGETGDGVWISAGNKYNSNRDASPLAFSCANHLRCTDIRSSHRRKNGGLYS